MWCWGGSFGGVWTCVVEQVKETVSSEGLQMKGPTLTYRYSLERPHSVPMQSHLGSVVLFLISIAWLGTKFFGTFTRIVGKVYNLYRV